MFNDLSSLTTIIYMLLIGVFVIFVAYKFVLVKVLKKKHSSKLDELIDRVQKAIVALMKEDAEIKKIETEKGRDAVIEYVLLQLKTYIKNENILNYIELKILDIIDLEVVAMYIVDQLENLGILTSTDKDTEFDELVDEAEEIADDALNLAEQVKEAIDGDANDAAELETVTSNVIDTVAENVDEIVDTAKKVVGDIVSDIRDDSEK